MKKDVSSAMVELINKMREEIAVIAAKIDTLISKSSIRPAVAKPFQQPGHIHNNQSDRAQGNNFRERVLHRAICADCKKGCEVPFKPSGERPVYCKECFSKRKARGPFKARPDDRPREPAPAQAAYAAKPQGAVRKKPAAKKRPAAKRKK